MQVNVHKLPLTMHIIDMHRLRHDAATATAAIAAAAQLNADAAHALSKKPQIKYAINLIAYYTTYACTHTTRSRRTEGTHTHTHNHWRTAILHEPRCRSGSRSDRLNTRM